MTMASNALPSKDFKTEQQKQSRRPPFEFCGPGGTMILMLILPILVLCLAHWSRIGRVDLSIFCHLPQLESTQERWSFRETLCPFMICSTGEHLSTTLVMGSGDRLGDEMTLSYSGIAACSLVLIGWFLFQMSLERFLPCELVQGSPVASHPEQVRLTYRINGHLALWCTLLLVTVGWPVRSTGSNDDATISSWQLQSFPFWSLLFEYFGELAMSSILLCFALSSYLYLDSFSRVTLNGKSHSKVLAEGGQTGYAVYDFFMGRELNPRLWSQSFDWKEFCELRPGLIGWILLNVASAHEQYKVHGAVSNSMYLINIFHGLYVWDALYQEKAILTTMDITTDGFGFMLVFGDLCWVPFIYSLQSRYLVHNDPHLTWWQLVLIIALHLTGYTIFRGANGQKDAFRRDPTDPALAHLTFLPTRRGTKLLTSGWWGLARKINYTGDFIMGLSWCLVCGFESIVPYFYAVYFLVLLVHRSLRDDHMCSQKYGDDWTAYKKLVPWRFVPGVV